jgi:hypothetical protein
MQKKFKLVAVLLVLSLLTACGGGAAPVPGDHFRRPDFGQPERAPDVSGIIKSVVANKVVVIELPGRDTNRNLPVGTEENTQDSVEPASVTRPIGFGSSGMPMGGGRPPMEQGEDSRAQMLEKLKEMSVGEKTITIPVGIQMLKPGASGSDAPEMLEATLKDIVADKMIMVWLNETAGEENLASFVLITK